MCGIVGYIGKENARDVIINGLQKLEYRGYDSAGLSIMKNDQIETYKDVGRVKKLSDNTKGISSRIGIGHTRWATHGVPNKVNSHPHSSSNGRISVVHNGVIENFEEVKRIYIDESKLISETDTEIIAHLIEKFVYETGKVKKAIQRIMDILDGSYALGIIDSERPGKVYACKNKSPLLIGTSTDGNMIASDIMAMIGYADNYVVLNDKSIVEITDKYVKVYGAGLEEIKIEEKPLNIKDEEIELGIYEHYMLKEIDEQPFIIRKIIEKYTKQNEFYIDDKIKNLVNEADRIYIIAAGTSMHAGYVGKYMFEQISNIPTEVHISSEFVYHTPLISEKPLFIFISQSGETADSIAVLKKISSWGYKSITITNVETSTLARDATYYLPIYAGPEIAVASTKAYVAQVTVLAILSYVIKVEDTTLDLRKELAKIANSAEILCSKKEMFKDIADEYLVKRNCFYIGRGLDYYVALEGALKLKEISYIQTEGFAAGELKHGTIALIEEDTPVIAIISQSVTNLNTRSNVKEVEARGAKTLIISTKGNSVKTDQIILDDVHPLLSPLVTVIPTQLLAYYGALRLGNDIDKPRNLAKSVTVE